MACNRLSRFRQPTMTSNIGTRYASIFHASPTGAKALSCRWLPDFTGEWPSSGVNRSVLVCARTSWFCVGVAGFRPVTAVTAGVLAAAGFVLIAFKLATGPACAWAGADFARDTGFVLEAVADFVAETDFVLAAGVDFTTDTGFALAAGAECCGVTATCAAVCCAPFDFAVDCDRTAE